MKRTLLLPALAALLLPLSSFAANTEVVDGITWTYTVSNGKASVGGDSYSSSTAVPRSTTGAITIPSRLGGRPVTRVGSSAFYGCSGLTSITIPDTVTSIGDDAFYGCSGLVEVHVSDLAAWCGISFEDATANPCCYAHQLFLNGEEITELVIPNGVTSIGDYAFYGCSGVTSITIPESVTSVGDDTFHNCSQLMETQIQLSDPSAWATNTINSKLKGARRLYVDDEEVISIVVPDGVTNIGSSAFAGCSGLTSITIPNSVTSIGGYAFYGCSGLTSITIPDSVTSIGGYAFYGCSGLQEVNISDLVAWCGIGFGDTLANPCTYAHHLFLNGEEITDLVIPDGVTSIGNAAFSGCSSLATVTISTAVTSIGDGAFSGCSGIKDVVVPGDFGLTVFPSAHNSITNAIVAQGSTSISDYAFKNGFVLMSVTIPDTVTSIGYYAFSGCSDTLFDTTSIPGVKLVDGWVIGYTEPDRDLNLEGIRGIAHHAFSNCSYLRSVRIPEGVTSIGDYAFYECSNLVTIIIPDGVTSIGGIAFYGCSGLSSITIPDGVTSIGDYAFEGCSGLTSITIPDSVTNIGDFAFYDCSGLLSITISDSVTSIGEYTFGGSNVNGSRTTRIHITDMGRWTTNSFNSRLSGTRIVFVDGAEITDVSIPNGVTSIGPGSFSRCSGLTSVTIPNGVTSIGGSAFYGCSGLTSITIPNGVTSIGDYAFYGCSGLTLITIPDGVTSIGDYAFEGCSGLTSIAIPKSVTSIGEDAFYECYHLTTVYLSTGFVGPLDWVPDGASIVWCSSVGNGKWVIPEEDESLSLGAPLVAPSGEVVIPAEIDGRPVVEIGADAFAGNTAITLITIPTSVTNIADGAFAGCTGLRRVEIGGMWAERLADLFPDAVEGIEEVVFLDGVTAIPDNFFEECTALRTMDLAESVVDIGTNVFEVCSALTTTVLENGLEMYQGWVLGFAGGSLGALAPSDLAIPAEYEDETARPEGSPHHGTPYSVRGIAAGAFEGEWGIGTVSLPESLRFVGARAFKDCTSLESISVPEGVAKIDREAFRNCTYAQGLALPGTLREIGDGAFANASMLMGATLPDGVVSVGSCAFSNCWRMLSVAIPQSVERVGDGAFADCRRVVGVTVPLHVRPMSELFPAAYASLATIAVAATDGSLGELAPSEAEAWLASRQMVPEVFKGCAALEGIELPAWVRNVSDGALEGCASISSLELPDAVTNVGARACAGMAALELVALPASLVSIGDEAFDGDAGLAALHLPEGLRTIGERAFRGLVPLARAEIPGSVRAIGDGAFAGCASIRAVSMPGDAGTAAAVFPDCYANIVSATVVAEDGSPGELAPPNLMAGLFEGCAALTSVELPAELAEIGAEAFADCTSLAEIGLPAAVTNLGERAFAGCGTLSSIALPKSLEELRDGTFAGCASIAEIVVPESVRRFGNGIFDGCTLLRSVRFVGNAPAYGAADGGPYAGVPAGAKSYVANGSKGWDGIATSMALPEYWPAGTVYEIGFWTPNRFDAAFDPNHGGEAAVEVEQVTGTSYVLPPDPMRLGARFAGWWTAPENGARVTASMQVTATRPLTFYAHWTMNRYYVHFEANGGSGTAEPVEMTVGTPAPLPPCPFAKVAHDFAGWATEPGGEVVYADGAQVADLAYAQNAAVTFYAVWRSRDWTLADYVDAPALSFGTAGGGAWGPDWDDAKAGGVSLRCDGLPPAAGGGTVEATLHATVTGAGTLAFWWKASCEPEDEDYGEWYDYATFAVDGAEISRIAGDSGWVRVECAVEGAGAHELLWTFTRDDYDEDGADWENALWVDGVEWTPAPVTLSFDAGGAAEGAPPAAVVKFEGYALVLPGPGTLADPPRVFAGWSDGENLYAAGQTYVFGSADAVLTAVWTLHVWTLSEAVDAPALGFAAGGAANWTVDTASGWTNGVSAKSGAVASGQSSWIETTVSGGGTVSFRWKVLGGIFRNTPFAYAKVEVDGTNVAQTHLTNGWGEVTLSIEGQGTHTVRWTYLRTSARTCDGDCAWLDAVSWTPAGATSVVVEGVEIPVAWFDENAAAAVAAAGGDYAAAANATAANGTDKVWQCYVSGVSPTNATERFEARIEFENGTPVVTWTPDLGDARDYVVLGKTNLLESAWGPTNGSTRFFRVKVQMP